MSENVLSQEIITELFRITDESNSTPVEVRYGFDDFLLSDPRENIEFFNGKVIGRGNVYIMKQSYEYSNVAKENLDFSKEVVQVFSK